MADDADRASALMQEDTEIRLELIKKQAAIPAGKPGTCHECVEESPRLVGGMCARCRDGV